MGDALVDEMEEFKVPKKAVKRKMVEQSEKEDAGDMDTESIESGVLSGVEGTLPKAKPAFPPIKREKLADGSEVRKIPVPSHRYSPLKENWMKIFEPIVEHLKLQVRNHQIWSNNPLIPSFIFLGEIQLENKERGSQNLQRYRRHH